MCTVTPEGIDGLQFALICNVLDREHDAGAPPTFWNVKVADPSLGMWMIVPLGVWGTILPDGGRVCAGPGELGGGVAVRAVVGVATVGGVTDGSNVVGVAGSVVVAPGSGVVETTGTAVVDGATVVLSPAAVDVVTPAAVDVVTADDDGLGPAGFEAATSLSEPWLDASTSPPMSSSRTTAAAIPITRPVREPPPSIVLAPAGATPGGRSAGGTKALAAGAVLVAAAGAASDAPSAAAPDGTSSVADPEV
jgi:hypothetical protein